MQENVFQLHSLFQPHPLLLHHFLLLLFMIFLKFNSKIIREYQRKLTVQPQQYIKCHHLGTFFAFNCYRIFAKFILPETLFVLLHFVFFARQFS